MSAQPETRDGARSAGPDSALATALLPVLLHRINNTTQLVSGLNAFLSLEPVIDEARAADLAQAAAEADDLGWLLGVLAGGMGADLLLSRVERRGLEPVLRLVRDGLRREGKDLELPRTMPDLLPEGGWHACWTLAEIAWAAGSSSEATPTLTLELTPATWLLRGDGGAGEALRECVERLREQASPLVYESAGPTWTVSLPRAWLGETHG